MRWNPILRMESESCDGIRFVWCIVGPYKPQNNWPLQSPHSCGWIKDQDVTDRNRGWRKNHKLPSGKGSNECSMFYAACGVAVFCWISGVLYCASSENTKPKMLTAQSSKRNASWWEKHWQRKKWGWGCLSTLCKIFILTWICSIMS